MRTNLKFPIVVILLLLVFKNFHVKAGAKVENQKKAILLVAFGTTVPEANVAYENIDKEFKKAFSNEEIRWAYTSKMIRKIIKKKGKPTDSPAEALAKLGEEGFTHVAVQSLHVIPGEEYHKLLTTVYRFNRMPKGIHRAVIADPLLSVHEDMLQVSKVLTENIPVERKADEAVVFMGHGSHHAANVYYPGMQYYLWNLDKNIFMGTVEGAPSLDEVLKKLKEKKIKKVWLMPFMAVAGDHAKNDMAGSEKGSWKSVLEKQGFEVEVVLKGIAELDDIVSIWIKHLEEKF